MDKKSIAILLVASSFTSSVFATSILNKLTSKHSSATPAIAKTHKTTDQTNHSYINFSGTWIADCGDGPMEPTIILNDADYITIYGQTYRIGQGLQGIAESNEEYSSYDHNSFEWNSNGSALIMKGVGVSKDNIDNSVIQTDADTFTLTMKNGQINLDGKVIMLEDLTHEEPLAVHCVFSKKQ